MSHKIPPVVAHDDGTDQTLQTIILYLKISIVIIKRNEKIKVKNKQYVNNFSGFADLNGELVGHVLSKKKNIAGQHNLKTSSTCFFHRVSKSAASRIFIQKHGHLKK